MHRIDSLTSGRANAVTGNDAAHAAPANDGNHYRFCATRYNSNGTLDTTWNGTGIVRTTIGINGRAFAATVLADAKVLLA